MANTYGPYGFRWTGNLAAGAAAISKRIITKSGLSLKVGDPIALTGGLAHLAGVTSTAIPYVALEDVTGVTATKKSVLAMPTLRDYIFRVQTRSAVNMTLGWMQGGKNVGITGTTNGKIGIGPSATTSVCKIVGLAPGSALGSYAELLVVFIKGFQG